MTKGSAGYSAAPLAKKLGIAAGTRVALVAAPVGFEALLGPLPEGARLELETAEHDLTLWFVRSAAELAAGIGHRRHGLGARGLWLCWRKKSSGLAGDLSESTVRNVGLAAGLVDHKICAVDETWSALWFAVRKP